MKDEGLSEIIIEEMINPPSLDNLAKKVGLNIKKLNCDLLANSGRFNPVVHLDCHCGAKTFFDEDAQAFLPQ